MIVSAVIMKRWNMQGRNSQWSTFPLIYCLCGFIVSCGVSPTKPVDDNLSDVYSTGLLCTVRVGVDSRSPLVGKDGRFVWKAPDGFVFACKATATIEPPSDFSVSDVPDDNGHYLKLSWSPSLSEETGMVQWYYIFRSRSPSLTEPKALGEFSDITSLDTWEETHTVLVDSTAAGTTEFTDCVPLNGVVYHYWLQSVGGNVQEGNTVTGIVTDQNGTPLEGVLIRLYDPSGAYDEYTVSLSDGSYIFEGVPSGSYYLVAKRDNYTLFSDTVTIP
jgi:hypothetical protein